MINSTTKKCSICGMVKNHNEFNLNSKRKDGLQTVCRSCNKAKNNEWYIANKQIAIDKAKKRRNLIRDHVSTYKKSCGCQLCGETDHVYLDFHHFDPSKKKFSIASSLGGVAIKELVKEINKCVVLCAYCHRDVEIGRKQAPQPGNTHLQEINLSGFSILSKWDSSTKEVAMLTKQDLDFLESVADKAQLGHYDQQKFATIIAALRAERDKSGIFTGQNGKAEVWSNGKIIGCQG